MFDAHRVGMGSEAVVSRLIEVTNLPLFRAVEIGPMDCPCNG